MRLNQYVGCSNPAGLNIFPLKNIDLIRCEDHANADASDRYRISTASTTCREVMAHIGHPLSGPSKERNWPFIRPEGPGYKLKWQCVGTPATCVPCGPN